MFNAGYASPVRTPRGRDILAACGQLKSATEKLSARERLALRAMAMDGVTFVGRIIVIVFAIIVATLAAGIAIAIGILGATLARRFRRFGERAVLLGSGIFRRRASPARSACCRGRS